MNLHPATYAKIEDAMLQLRGLYNVEDFSWNILFCHRVPSEICRGYVHFFFIAIHCSLSVWCAFTKVNCSVESFQRNS